MGIEPTTQKTHGPADDAIYKGICGVLVRSTTHLQKVNQ